MDFPISLESFILKISQFPTWSYFLRNLELEIPNDIEKELDI